MKNITNLPQSKVLATFLPLKSADMGWNVFVDGSTRPLPIEDWELIKDGNGSVKFYPCWSLTALLDVLPVSCDDGRHCLTLINSNPNGETEWLCGYEDDNGNLMMDCYAETQVEACYEMIVKLHEKNRL